MWISYYDKIEIKEDSITGMMFIKRKLYYSNIIGYKLIETRRMWEKIYLIATNWKIEINPMYTDAHILRDWILESFPKIED